MEYEHIISIANDAEATDKDLAIEDLLTSLHAAADELEKMMKDGLVLDGIRGNLIRLTTDDPEIAKKYDMHECEEDLPGHLGSDDCECPVCELEAIAGHTMVRLDKIERALINVDLGFRCAGCEDFVVAGEGCEGPDNNPDNIVPIGKKENMN